MTDGNKIQLGKILLKQRLVGQQDLDDLLADQRQGHERLASLALERGLADELCLLKALSEQHGIPAVNLEEVEIDLSNLDLIPQSIAMRHVVLPVYVSGEAIRLAMASPDDGRVVEELEFVSGRKVFVQVALHSQLVYAIETCYAARMAGQTVYRGPRFGQRISEPLPPSKIEEPGGAGTVMADASDLPTIDVEVEFMGRPPDMAQVSHATQEPLPSLAPTAQVASSGQKRRILVVDDEDDIRLLITRVLKEKGYDVVSASRGLEAIRLVQTANPDMLVLDAMLPEVHGFDICKKIKSSSRYSHIPVIMISAIYRGWRYAKDLQESYGVDDFLEKPFKIGDLVNRVELLLQRTEKQARPEPEHLSQEAERILEAGIAAYRSGRLDDAIDLIRNGIAIDPLAAKLHYHLALLLGKKGLNYQAIRALENSLELAPDDFAALKNLAVLYQKSGFRFKAIETWERALGHSPDEETREGIKRHLVGLL
ncbi:MAG: response regulator [Myxococcota bacterium]|jgi:DNA-binding response OmpR family regulator|nr:response regulator [Myxococcota bacterium]